MHNAHAQHHHLEKGLHTCRPAVFDGISLIISLWLKAKDDISVEKKQKNKTCKGISNQMVNSWMSLGWREATSFLGRMMLGSWTNNNVFIFEEESKKWNFVSKRCTNWTKLRISPKM